VNQRLEYGGGLACEMCLSTAIIVASMKVYTIWSSRAVVPISGRGSIAIQTISSILSKFPMAGAAVSVVDIASEDPLRGVGRG
jgi:hypothetical protein